VVNKVYIIILNYNGWIDTIECIKSILTIDYQNYQLVIVDNNSQDKSLKKIQYYLSEEISVPFVIYDKNTAEQGGDWIKEDNKIILIDAQENKGYAAGNNVGIRFAQARNDYDYIWVLNNDTIVHSQALSNLVESANQVNNVGIWASKLLYYRNPDTIQNVGCTYNKWLCTSSQIGHLEKDEGQYNDDGSSRRIDFVVGASAFVTKRFIDNVGEMCEEYFLYCEELDWALRGKKEGFSLGYCFKSKVYHKEGGSIGSDTANKNQRSKLSDYYGIRSKLILTRKFYFLYLPFAYLGILTIVLFHKIKLKQYDRIPMIFKLLISTQN
jgi:GT2 family glycosyltransferase